MSGNSSRKRCPTCEQDLSRSRYHKDRHRWDGLVWECKECRRARSLAYFNAHKTEWAEDRKAAAAERRDLAYSPGMRLPTGPKPVLPDAIDESLSLAQAAKRYGVTIRTIQRRRAKIRKYQAETA